MAETSATVVATAAPADDDAAPPKLLVLRDHFQQLHDRAISEAKEHEPLFTVRWRLRDSEGRPVAFQRDGHRFTLEASMKLLQDEAYMLEIEIEDVGHTLTAISGLSIDGEDVKVETCACTRNETAGGVATFRLAAKWQPVHPPTAHGARDHSLLELFYVHGALERRELRVQWLQFKVYERAKRGRAAKVRDGLILRECSAKVDVAKGPPRWTYAELRETTPP